MPPSRRTLLVCLPLALALLHVPALRAQATSSPTPAKRTCSVTKPADTEADRTLNRRDFASAETLFRTRLAEATTPDDRAEATAGIIRAQLGALRLADALTTAKKALADFPKNATVIDAVGQVHFRRGEPDEAANSWNLAQSLDFCNPRVHYDIARYLRLNGMYATEQKQLDLAHTLSPLDPLYRRAAAPRVQMSDEDRLTRMSTTLESGTLSADDRASLQRAIEVVRAHSKGSCQIDHAVASTRLPIVPIANGPTDMYAAGLDIQLNGKKKRFELDSGASGLLISRNVAAAAGLISEAETRGTGIGDNGPAKELLAHIDSLKIGELEFHNCLVRVFDKKNVLDVDGLIGSDVFSSWVVTVDIPAREIRLTPLPKRPGDTEQTSGLDTAGADENTTSAPQDRFVAPEMKDWTPVFRYGHLLIFRTVIGKAASKLFLMDTGASRTLISPAAAREVTGVSGIDAHIKGISGEVNKVSETDNLDIIFARVRVPFRSVTAIDTSTLARGSGVEVSGLLGFEILRELVISIDYRDNLVHIVYDPNHGFHRR